MTCPGFYSVNEIKKTNCARKVSRFFLLIESSEPNLSFWHNKTQKEKVFTKSIKSNPVFSECEVCITKKLTNKLNNNMYYFITKSVQVVWVARRWNNTNRGFPNKAHRVANCFCQDISIMYYLARHHSCVKSFTSHLHQ